MSRANITINIIGATPCEQINIRNNSRIIGDKFPDDSNVTITIECVDPTKREICRNCTKFLPHYTAIADDQYVISGGRYIYGRFGLLACGHCADTRDGARMKNKKLDDSACEHFELRTNDHALDDIPGFARNK